MKRIYNQKKEEEIRIPSPKRLLYQFFDMGHSFPRVSWYTSFNSAGTSSYTANTRLYGTSNEDII